MKQIFHLIYKWEHESEFFLLSDVDRNFFACRYLGSKIGFVIDKQVFHKHVTNGKIQTYIDANMAV